MRWNKLLVGVDGSDGSRAALAAAKDEAVEHGSELVLVHSWVMPMPPTVPAYGSGFPWGTEYDPAEVARTRLADVSRDVLGEEPPVKVTSRVIEGNAAWVLIELSAEADLLVVGSRGHGGFAGLLLGSVSQHVAAHAHCNVLIVRSPE